MRSGQTVRLDFDSTFEMLDLVQVVSDHIGRLVGLDEEARHWVNVAVRESVINAIKHGNRNDSGKRVHVEFTPLEAAETPQGVMIRVRDEGPGSIPRAARPAGTREPPERQRPRHLPDPQLHGRNGPAARRRGRHGDGDGEARRPSPRRAHA